MGLEDVDFQSLVHQHVTQLIEGWKAQGFSDEEIQECASQCFNMGLIASQQVQQEGGIQPQGTEHTLPYTPEMAQRVVVYFLHGLNVGVVKAHEQRLPSQEKWQLLQNVAYHVFEQSKQAVVATYGQENTPEVQISDDQIINWLGQTAVEALLYYVNEHEKQHGPINRTDMQDMPDLLNQEQSQPQPEAAPAPQEQEQVPVQAQQSPVEPVPQQPAPQPAPTGAPEIHHKYAAVGLLLSTLSTPKQEKILNAFQPEEQQLINQYRDPELVARDLDLSLVAKYLRLFKEKMGQQKTPGKSKYASTVADVVQNLSSQRLEKLFQQERPLVRGYVRQFTQTDGRGHHPYTLPTGVEESLLLYLHRNFPQEVGPG